MTLRRWAAAGTVIVVLLAGGWYYFWYGLPIQRGSVAVPAADASADEVLRSYFAAVSMNDKATQRALWVDGRSDSLDSDEVWSVTGVDIRNQDVYRPVQGDEPALFGYHHLLRVLVSFSFHFLPIHENPQWPSSTFYLLVRNNDQDPWRIWGWGAYL